MKMRWCLLAVALTGFAMGPIGCTEMQHDGKSAAEERESDEVKVAFDKLPAPVQETFTKQAGGTAIKEVDQEKQNGMNVYEADAVIGGTNYEIVVAADGSLISKKIDDEAAEGGEKGKKASGEKDEQGEHKD